jgi:hypothetical protein
MIIMLCSIRDLFIIVLLIGRHPREEGNSFRLKLVCIRNIFDSYHNLDSLDNNNCEQENDKGVYHFQNRLRWRIN